MDAVWDGGPTKSDGAGGRLREDMSNLVTLAQLVYIFREDLSK